MRLRLAVLLSVLVVAPSAARAATITVNTTSSTFNAGDGLCSLPEAVASAGGFTVPDCVAGDPGVDDIVLPAGTIASANTVLWDVRLIGQGVGATILDGQGTDRVFIAQGTVELRGLTVAHGRAHDGGVDAAGQDGGGLLLMGSASVTLTDCAFTDNVAGHGGQGADQSTTQGDTGGHGGNGGGVAVPNGATLNVSRCTFSGNRAGAAGGGGNVTRSDAAGYGGLGGPGGSGGGIFAGSDSQVTIDRTTFTDNHAGDAGPGGQGEGDPSGNGGAGGFGGAGGGFASAGGPVTITASTFTANTSGRGGDGGKGVGAPLTTSDGNGGAGIDGGVGGAAYIEKGTSDPADAITNTTITGNVSGDGGNGAQGQGSSSDTVHFGASVGGAGAHPGFGGGLGAGVVRVTLLHDTVVANRLGAPGIAYGGASGPAGFAPGILNQTGSTATTIAKSIVSGCAGDPVTDAGFNLGSDGCPGSGADPELGSLQDNGGPVQTMRPGPGSPAVNAVPSDQGCAATDARGVPRPIGIACDIGAVELAPPTAVTMDPNGATLNGTVDAHGLATKVTFDYGESTAYGASLTALPTSTIGPLAESVTLGPLLPGTYHYRVAATNGDGAGVGADKTVTITGQQPPPGGGAAPVVSRLSVKPRRLRRGRTATVRFTISEAASVKLSFARRSGRRYRGAGSLARRVKAGSTSLSFRRKALKPGRYRLTLVATDAAGRRSKPVSTTFTVVAA